MLLSTLLVAVGEKTTTHVAHKQSDWFRLNMVTILSLMQCQPESLPNTHTHTQRQSLCTHIKQAAAGLIGVFWFQVVLSDQSWWQRTNEGINRRIPDSVFHREIGKQRGGEEGVASAPEKKRQIEIKCSRRRGEAAKKGGKNKGKWKAADVCGEWIRCCDREKGGKVPRRKKRQECVERKKVQFLFLILYFAPSSCMSQLLPHWIFLSPLSPTYHDCDNK